MADIEIEIDGKKLAAKPNQTVIQVADEAGIYIPRFCYHKHLTIPANCRMCLVEIEKAPKALPACATPVAPGMKVFTKSQKTIAAQRAVMEFLLINHPLDCPICDQGGECELQDLSMGYGSSQSRYAETKRAVADQDLGPLIATEMTRCIYCTRCVRFGDEVAGMRELGAIGRGEFTEISTYIQHAIKSEISGNIIDLCPVGALTNKPYRFTARPWELDQFPSISPHDCIGSNINLHARYGKVMRAASRENKTINETWIADRDRYSCTGLYHEDRLGAPRVRNEDGTWETTDWQRALLYAATGLQDIVLAAGAAQLGALASPSSTLEEFYLLQKLLRTLGCNNVDHRLRETDVSDQATMPAFPGFEMGESNIPDIANSDAIVIIGSNIQKEVPMLAVQVRKAASKGAAIVVVNAVDYAFNFSVAAKKIVPPQSFVHALQQLKDFKTHLEDKKNISFIVGAAVNHHPQAAILRNLVTSAANAHQARLHFITDGANSAGAWLAGCIPHREVTGKPVSQPGLSAYEMLASPRKVYVLLNVEPDVDCANAALATKALQQARFVIALSTYKNPILEKYAHVILPIGPFTETSGTFINAAGKWQSFKGAAKPVELSRPAWKVLSVLGRFLLLDGFTYESSEAVKHEAEIAIKQNPLLNEMPSVGKQSDQSKQSAPNPKNEKQTTPSTLTRIGEVPIYAVDAIVRRAQPLQETQTLMEGDVNEVRIHPETAARLKLQEGAAVSVKQAGSAAITLPLKLDARIAKDAAWIAGGIQATSELGALYNDVECQPVSGANSNA